MDSRQRIRFSAPAVTNPAVIVIGPTISLLPQR
jgi:hypothetical protein